MDKSFRTDFHVIVWLDYPQTEQMLYSTSGRDLPAPSGSKMWAKTCQGSAAALRPAVMRFGDTRPDHDLIGSRPRTPYVGAVPRGESPCPPLLLPPSPSPS